MKKFLKKVLAYLGIWAAICLIGGYVVDPYNVFHWENIRNNGVEPNKNYVKTKYIINNPDKFDSFVLGSSRVGSIHVENITSEKVYNMTYSVGLLDENFETLKTFVENGVHPDSVYVGIDSMCYTHDPAEHEDLALRCPYQLLASDPLHFAELYLDPKTILSSLKTIAKGGDILGYDTFYEYGWWCDYDEESSVDWDNAVAEIGEDYRMDQELELIQEMVDYCNANDINLVFFTNPMCRVTYEASVEENYLDFLYEVAQITDYYNFSGMNDLCADNANFLDTSHYTAQVGDMMINVIFNGQQYDDLYEQGFGWYVTSKNVGELIDILEE